MAFVFRESVLNILKSFQTFAGNRELEREITMLCLVTP